MATVTGSSYAAEIDTLDAGSVVPCAEWAVRENLQGWSGFGVVDTAPGEAIGYAEAFRRAVDYGLRPEAPVALGLWARPPEAATETEESGSASPAAPEGKAEMVNVRTWPSVVTEVGAPTKVRNRTSGVIVMFSDPIRYLLHSRIWGAYRDCSPGALLGAGLSLASGGDGAPTLTPALPGFPPLTIREALREPARELRYAIAAGEPLGSWLAGIFGALGIRIELIGRESGRVDITLRDTPPNGAPLSMTLLPGSPSASNAAIKGIRQRGQRQIRDTMYDAVTQGDPVRVGELTPPVGQMLFMTDIDIDEAAYLADFEEQRSELNLNTLEIVTEQPGIHPGRLLEFGNRSVSGASVWQVAQTCHGQGAGRYRNSADLVKSGVSWRPEAPPRKGPVTVTGVVDDGASELGEIVSRDVLGRIPVTIGMAFRVTMESDEEDAEAAGPVPAPAQLRLSITEPMAGGSHGFVPSHRQGDICRINVHSPVHAEIGGFLYGFDNRLAKNILDVSASIMASNPLARWSGMVFRPGDDADTEDEQIVSDWQKGAPAAASDETGGGLDADGADS